MCRRREEAGRPSGGRQTRAPALPGAAARRCLVADVLRWAETFVSPFSYFHKHQLHLTRPVGGHICSSKSAQSHAHSRLPQPVTLQPSDRTAKIFYTVLTRVHFRRYLKRISSFQLDSACCESHKKGLWRKLLCYTISAHAQPSDIPITPPTQRKGKALPRGTD